MNHKNSSIFSKRKNQLHFNMRIVFKMNQTKKISSPKIEIAFNFTKEIPVKITWTKQKFKSEIGSRKDPLGS